jgi:hypothetical protein
MISRMPQRIGRWQRYGLGPAITSQQRFGLLLDSFRVPAWQADCIRLLVDSGVAVPSLVVVSSAGARRRPARDVLPHVLYYAARATIWRSPATVSTDITDLLSGVPSRLVKPRADGGAWQVFDEVDVAAIRDADLDFMLRFGFNLLRGDLLDAARHGVWSFHHGDERRYRGRPAAFWELHDGATEIGVVLQRLTERLDAGVILRRGVFAVDPWSYLHTLERAYRGAVDFPLQVSRDLALGNALESQPSATKAPVRRLPGHWAVLRTLARTAVSAIRRAGYGAFVLKRWSIGRCEGNPRRLLDGDVEGVRWLAGSRRTKFLADPVAVPGTEGRIILCESLDYAVGRGRIVRLDVQSDGHRQHVAAIQTLIDEPSTHMSYPSLVRLPGGELLCTPEASSTESVVAFRLSSDARRVSERTTLLEGIAAVDPTIFRFGGRWWLACTEDGATAGSHLWLYHAGSPLGPWSAHARNPVKIDVRGARPAGSPIQIGDYLYRPAQDCSSGYGRAVTLHRILALTTTEFEEELVATLRPDPGGPNPDGLHTISVDGEAIVVDGYVNVIHPLAGWYRLRARRSKNGRNHRAVEGR